jgi:hypothetical protein
VSGATSSAKVSNTGSENGSMKKPQERQIDCLKKRQPLPSTQPTTSAEWKAVIDAYCELNYTDYPEAVASLLRKRLLLLSGVQKEQSNERHELGLRLNELTGKTIY